jgi:hypothetical protein
MLGHTTALYSCLYALFARLLWPACALLLAAMAASSLLHSETMCQRVLESPGVQPVLLDLHRGLSLLQ